MISPAELHEWSQSSIPSYMVSYLRQFEEKKFQEKLENIFFEKHRFPKNMLCAVCRVVHFMPTSVQLWGEIQVFKIFSRPFCKIWENRTPCAHKNTKKENFNLFQITSLQLHLKYLQTFLRCKWLWNSSNQKMYNHKYCNSIKQLVPLGPTVRGTPKVCGALGIHGS